MDENIFSCLRVHNIDVPFYADVKNNIQKSDRIDGVCITSLMLHTYSYDTVCDPNTIFSTGCPISCLWNAILSGMARQAFPIRNSSIRYFGLSIRTSALLSCCSIMEYVTLELDHVEDIFYDNTDVGDTVDHSVLKVYKLKRYFKAWKFLTVGGPAVLHRPSIEKWVISRYSNASKTYLQSRYDTLATLFSPTKSV